MRIDIWSDIVCPWCYIGKRRFERALDGFEHRDELEIVHRSFQLDPHSPRRAVRNHRDVLMAKYGMSEAEANAAQVRMEHTAVGEGLEFHLVGGVTGNTFDAHRVVHFARERGMQDAVIERLYRAHFTERRSIFGRDSLAAVAVDAGLDRAGVIRVLDSEAYADAVRADNEAARALGASGVPFYVFDEQFAVSGAQPSDVFTTALTRAFKERQGVPADSDELTGEAG
jgi:predicted DsbA family dithiol-disulfide isomerase